MFANLTYRQKLKWLGAAAILALILCYELSVKNTVQEYVKYELANGPGNGPERPAYSAGELGTREARIGSLYNRYLLDTLSSDKNLLSITSNYCKTNHMQLKEYKAIGLAKTDSIQVLTRIVTVEGGFIPGLKLIYQLETGKNAGRISSAEFSANPDPRTKITKLDCTIYVQNLIPD
jgi:hypothetical protein